jgi:hypothetical protein
MAGQGFIKSKQAQAGKETSRAEQSSEEAGEQTLTASKQLIKKVMGGAGR